MEGRQLLQYIIDTSDVVLAKKQEATEYLAKLEAAQQNAHQTRGKPLKQTVSVLVSA
jgi:hypothetical protein